MDDTRIADNPRASRFELESGGALAAHADYEMLEGAVRFIHTEVLPAHEGRGLGSKLAKFALDDVRRRGLKVIPACPFIAGYIRKHGEYADLVVPGPRA